MRAVCCCKAVAILLDAEPLLNGVCHCDNCRRRTGSALGWSVYFPASVLAHDPEGVSVYAFDAESGRQERRFCATCGTTLYWTNSASPGVIGFAGGCLEEGELQTPTLSAYDSRRHGWIELDAALQRAL